MISWLFPLVVGLLAGMLSACGLGGGTLLLIYLLEINGMEQHLAQGINLLFFLPSGFLALPAHIKGKFVEKFVLIPTLSTGFLAVFLGAFVGEGMEKESLRMAFGGLLILVAVLSLFHQEKEDTKTTGDL